MKAHTDLGKKHSDNQAVPEFVSKVIQCFNKRSMSLEVLLENQFGYLPKFQKLYIYIPFLPQR